MLPEIVLIENERGTLLQVNSLGPVYAGRMERFMRQALAAPPRRRAAIPYRLEPDSRDAWRAAVGAGLDAIGEGRVDEGGVVATAETGGRPSLFLEGPAGQPH